MWRVRQQSWSIEEEEEGEEEEREREKERNVRREKNKKQQMFPRVRNIETEDWNIPPRNQDIGGIVETLIKKSIHKTLEDGVTLVKQGSVADESLGIAREGSSVTVLEVGLVPVVKLGIDGWIIRHDTLEGRGRGPVERRSKGGASSFNTFFGSVAPSFERKNNKRKGKTRWEEGIRRRRSLEQTTTTAKDP